jgi:hypothetical protein
MLGREIQVVDIVVDFIVSFALSEHPAHAKPIGHGEDDQNG